MKRFIRSFSVSSTIFIFFLVQFLALLPSPVHASAPYEASDVLGQADFDSREVNYGNEPVTRFANYGDIALDLTNHRLFVTDSPNNRVLIFNLDTNNELQDKEADNVLGQNHLETTTAGLSANQLDDPYGLAFDTSSNRLFVSDSTNNRVLVFDTSTITNNEDAIYVLGQVDFTSNSPDTNAKGFQGPTYLYFNSENDLLYVSDHTNNRVLIFDTTIITNNENAVYVLGQVDFVTNYDTGGGGATASTLTQPMGITLDPIEHKLYVADFGKIRVLAYDLDSGNLPIDKVADAVIGQNDFINGGGGAASVSLYGPHGLDYDLTTHRLFVADTYNNRVLIYDTTTLSTTGEAAINVLGQSDFGLLEHDININGFDDPLSLAYNGDVNKLYVFDSTNYRILLFDVSTVTNNEDSIYVLGQDNYDSTTVSATAVGFNDDGLSPVLDTVHQRLFVSDSTNSRVLVFNLDENNNLIDKTADYVLGQSNFTSSSYGETASSLYNPGGMSYDVANNRLFVMDAYNCRVVVYDTEEIVTGEPAVNVIGSTDINSAGSCATSQSTFNYLYYGSVAYDPTTERLYVSDSYDNYRILVFDLTGGITNGMNASYVLGATDFDTPGGGNVTADELYGTYGGGLIIDTDSQKLFAVLYDQNRILAFDVNEITNGEPAVAVLGQYNFTSSDSLTTQTGLNGPEGAGFDPVQKLLFISDYGNGRIIIYDVNEVATGEQAIGVLGAPDFETVGEGYNSSTVSQFTVYPYDHANMDYDSDKRRLYLGDDGHARVLIFDFAHLKDLPTTLSTNNSVNETLGEGNQGTTTYTLDSGTLPTGLSFNTQTGVLSGTPTSEGTYTFTITISDDNGVVGTYTDTKTYTVIIISPVTKPEGEYSTTETPTCTAQAPSTPDLFQVTSLGNTSASIHFSPSSGSVSKYFISFGETEEAEGYSATLDMGQTDGAITYTLELLKPYTTYYVKVNATNNCMPSAWSATIPFRTSTYQSYFPGSSISNLTTPAQVFGTSTNSDSSIKKDESDMKGTTTQQDLPKPNTPTATASSQPSWFDSVTQWVKSKLGL